MREYPAAEVKMIESAGGIFDVTVDGTRVFSKFDAGRHARPGEVLEQIRRLRGDG